MRKIVIVALLLAGCSFGLKQANTEPVSRVPVVREELPLPELEDQVSQKMRQFPSEAETTAKVEVLEAQTAAEVYREKQTAKQEAYDRQKTRDIELAALEDKLRTETKALAEQARAELYDSNKWLWAVLAAGIALIAWAARKVSWGAAMLGLAGFAFLFALVLAGKNHPDLVALGGLGAGLCFAIFVVWVAYKNNLLVKALKATVTGIERGNDARTKKEVAKADHGVGAVERVARGMIDEAGEKS